MTKCHENYGLLMKADKFIALGPFSCSAGPCTLKGFHDLCKWKDVLGHVHIPTPFETEPSSGFT